MARGRGRRDKLDIANDTLSDLVGPSFDPLPLAYAEDRRLERDQVSPIPGTVRGRRARIVSSPVAFTLKGARSRSRQFNVDAFHVPREVAVCVRRKVRKQVLMAKGKGGKNRPPRRGPWSHIHCRRK